MRHWITALRAHWPEYLIEAALLGIFMVSASAFTILLEHPASPVAEGLDQFVRRMLIGIAMGVTALVLITSPWGKRSGAHFNPAVTLTYWYLGKVGGSDAFFYVAAQFAGAVVGVGGVAVAVPRFLAHASVNYVATMPGKWGTGMAFVAEFVISFVLMRTMLAVSNHRRLSRFTPCFAAVMVATFITFEGPLSGMSMNPARTFGSGFVGQIWTAIWVYFAAPVLAMLTAALIYRRTGRIVYCAKLHHHNDARCIFNCAFGDLIGEVPLKIRPDATAGGGSNVQVKRPCEVCKVLRAGPTNADHEQGKPLRFHHHRYGSRRRYSRLEAGF